MINNISFTGIESVASKAKNAQAVKKALSRANEYFSPYSLHNAETATKSSNAVKFFSESHPIIVKAEKPAKVEPDFYFFA